MSLRETFVYTGYPVVFNELQDKQIVYSCRQIHQYNVVFEDSCKQFVYLVTWRNRIQSCALDSWGLTLVSKVLNVILVWNTWDFFTTLRLLASSWSVCPIDCTVLGKNRAAVWVAWAIWHPVGSIGLCAELLLLMQWDIPRAVCSTTAFLKVWRPRRNWDIRLYLRHCRTENEK